MRLTRSAIFVALVSLLVAGGVLVGLHAARRHAGAEARFAANLPLVRWLGVTDLCLFTDARYTRHPSLADRHSPFQDYPLAMEHFPSGSLVLPPAHLTSAHKAAPLNAGSGRL